MKRLLVIFFVFSKLNANLNTCIQQSEAAKNHCTFKCIQASPNASKCEEHYVITPCMEKWDDINDIYQCIYDCIDNRSQNLNDCYYNEGLDPDVPSPSCGMCF